jgi:hypothetical protein
MEEQVHHQSQSEESLVSPTTIVSIISQIITSGLDEAGYKNASHVIKKWPQLLGKNTVRTLKKLLQKKEEGKPITPEDHKDVANALQSDPKDAAILLGLLTADILEGTLDARTERKVILDSYNVVFGIICTFMTAATTSVALKGFIHDEHCISYWDRKGKTPQFSAIGDDYLFPNSLGIYLLNEEPTDLRLVELNLQIRQSFDRRLQPKDFDFEKEERVWKLEKVQETSIIVHRLRPDRDSLPKPVKEPLFGLVSGTDYSKPIEDSICIPPGAPALIGLVQSLREAKEVLRYHAVELQKTEGRAIEENNTPS